MRAFITFNRGMLHMPLPWQLWLLLLVGFVVNFVQRVLEGELPPIGGVVRRPERRTVGGCDRPSSEASCRYRQLDSSWRFDRFDELTMWI